MLQQIVDEIQLNVVQIFDDLITRKQCKKLYAKFKSNAHSMNSIVTINQRR